jgi:hypothetical protein
MADTGTTPDESADTSAVARLRRVQRAWYDQLGPGERSVVLSWGSFAGTFATARTVTHLIRAGIGPKSGGLSLGGHHFHHYNIGIATLMGVGGIAIRGRAERRLRPVAAVAYGFGVGLIVDEAALLLDLQDVYWSKQGRTSVDVAVTIIAIGGLTAAGLPFWPVARNEFRKNPLR